MINTEDKRFIISEIQAKIKVKNENSWCAEMFQAITITPHFNILGVFFICIILNKEDQVCSFVSILGFGMWILLPVFTPKLAVSSCFQSWKQGNYTKLLAATHYLMFGYRLTLSRKQRLKFSKTLNYSFLTHLFTGIFWTRLLSLIYNHVNNRQ